MAGNFSVAKKLVDLDPTVLQKKDSEKLIVLHFVASSRNTEMVEWLLQKDENLSKEVTTSAKTTFAHCL